MFMGEAAVSNKLFSITNEVINHFQTCYIFDIA